MLCSVAPSYPVAVIEEQRAYRIDDSFEVYSFLDKYGMEAKLGYFRKP